MVGLIEEKRLAEIIKRCYKEAQFGYGLANNTVYFKDVDELLRERQELFKRIAALQALAVPDVDTVIVDTVISPPVRPCTDVSTAGAKEIE